ncbi:MAG: ABC transporter ATP-binding protein, partial [Rhodothermales bacterium]|nr:ABC transporter ATP-binding protein [Rhodothermales bacterium]
KKSLKEGVKIRRLAARLQGTVQVMTGISSAAVLFYGGVLVLGGSLTPGELLVFLSYLKAMMKPVQDFAKYSSRLAKASSASERVMELFAETPTVVDAPDAVPAPAFKGGITFREVGFSYGNGHPHLQDVDLTIAPGERVAIVGASGHGKSTLVSLVPRLYDPQHGAVLLDGTDLKRYTIESVRRQISIVLQSSTLFAASVAENISYGCPDASLEDIRDAARLANADEFITDLADGYDTILGEGGSTISTGQRQRIALARAAVRRTPIMILDEPTTGLDEAARQNVITALERVSEGRTVLLVTHDLDLAARADRVVYVEEGRVLENASHETLLANGDSYARLYRLQQQGFADGAAA